MTTTTHPGLDRIVATFVDLPDVAQAHADFAAAQLRFDLAVAEQSALPDRDTWPTQAQQDQMAYEVAWTQTRLLEAWGVLAAAQMRERLEAAD